MHTLRLLNSFLTFFWLFCPPGAGRPREPISTHFSDFFTFRLQCPSEWSMGSQGLGGDFWRKSLCLCLLSGFEHCLLRTGKKPYPPFRNYYAINPSEIISRNDYANFAQSSQKEFLGNILAQWQTGHCANLLLEACYKNSKKAESNNKIAQSPRKQFPKSYFAQSIATISRSPSENERQVTHLICARLKYDLYDFFRGCFWAFYTRKTKEAGPKHPLKKSYRSYFRRAQIRWVIWRSSSCQWQQHFSTIKFALSNFYCRGVSHEKQRFGRFASLPPRPPTSKSENLSTLGK